jgi:hypothetical protein
MLAARLGHFAIAAVYLMMRHFFRAFLMISSRTPIICCFRILRAIITKRRAEIYYFM